MVILYSLLFSVLIAKYTVNTNKIYIQNGVYFNLTQDLFFTIIKGLN